MCTVFVHVCVRHWKILELSSHSHVQFLIAGEYTRRMLPSKTFFFSEQVPANPLHQSNPISHNLRDSYYCVFINVLHPREVLLVNSRRGVPSHMSWSTERKTPSSSSSLSKLSLTGFDFRLPLAKTEARLLSWCSGNGNQLLAHSAIAWESQSGTLNRIVFINSQ